jgi:DNA-binding LacI/PurR family transcriptional regulator
MAERPAGLAVTDDAMAQGVIKALLERQVRVPEQLRLMTLKNAHVDLFIPLSVSHVVFNETDIARALLEQVQKQFRGEPCEAIYIAPTLSR